jgi:hypothetical protein
MTAFTMWKPLDATEVTGLPEAPGVFEIATLVRNVLFIGSATESLASTLQSQLESPAVPHARAGRLYFRYAATDEAERLQAELLARYRDRHGALPAAQTTVSPQRQQRHLKAV